MTDITGSVKPGRIIGALAGLVGLGGAAAWWQLFRRPLPQTAGTLHMHGLDAAVEIRRDRWGVPHIYAASPRDLWFAQGFCFGQDRLWQLDLYRRVADGRLAEIAGPAALPSDRLMRTLGLRRVAEREAREMPDDVAEALVAISAGINAAAARAAALPVEFQILRLGFEPWQPSDTLASQKLLSFGLSTNWERELLRAEMGRALGPELAARLDPTYPKGTPIVLEPGGDGAAPSEVAARIDDIRRYLGLAVEATGSNNWAVAGELSATGRPLLAGDPHLAPSMPGITYQVGLYLGDRFARGASLPGAPGIAFGQNNDVAWSFTNVMADVMDLFVERIEGERYRFAEEWRELETRTEEIAVRGRPADRLTVRATHHGPIVNEALGADESEPLALSWAALHFPAVARAHVSVLDASSGSDLVARLEDYATPVINLVWADRHGSIGYKAVGKVPMREGGSPDLPRCGWSGEDEWVGWIPHDELPEVTDPESGFVVTANNKVEPDDYPHHLTSEYLDGARAARIEDLLRRTDEHDLDGFARMQTDMLSLRGLETAKRLARLSPRSQAETRAIERLRSWDGRMTPESIAATIYQAFTLHFGNAVARAAIGDRDLAERWLDRADNGFMTHVTSPWRWQAHLLDLWEEGDEELIGCSWDELALDALRSALNDLADRYGDDPEGWRWGRVHPLHFPHALGGANALFRRIFSRELEVGGAQETVAQVGWDPGDPYTAVWAPCWRIVADPVHPERSRWQQFTGNSGHVASEHYDDLQPRWRDGFTQPLAGEGPWRVLTLTPG